MHVTSLGGALGWQFRGLAIVCKRQFFFVWKFTNHQWKRHRDDSSFEAKPLASSLPSGGGSGGSRVCPPCPWPSNYSSMFLSISRFQGYCKHSFSPRNRASLWPVPSERLSTEGWWEPYKCIHLPKPSAPQSELGSVTEMMVEIGLPWRTWKCWFKNWELCDYKWTCLKESPGAKGSAEEKEKLVWKSLSSSLCQP